MPKQRSENPIEKLKKLRSLLRDEVARKSVAHQQEAMEKVVKAQLDIQLKWIKKKQKDLDKDHGHEL